MAGLGEVYGRVIPFARAMPLLFALPVVAEFAQHVVELHAGMFVAGGAATAASAPARMILGAVKVIAILAVVLLSARYWRFGNDPRAAYALDAAFALGVGVLLMTQVGLLVVLFALSKLLALLIGPGPETMRIVAVVLMILSLCVAVLLAPWFVGLVARDPDMTAGRSIAASRRALFARLGLYIGAYLPGLALHYALNYGAMGASTATIWAAIVVDSLLVGGIAVLIGSAYYSLYALAVQRDGAPRSS
ncbi:hypothetical protein PQ455_13890 [Sphingomonas naphthae]|uniref:DUF4013 domain-containing protein n=1 Tax=Sphingomonas naphthae TaxID=1813468 RepID=A0ABY7TKA7_9SPHN|nr:hypothetical protein [Sphingomonas naphthae]WCT72719.1 hypothetical protein PQ455_13890 [Sphingomonas naphthae]